jgi:hypothetical protein
MKTAVESFFIGRFNTKEFQSLLQRVTPRQIVDSIQIHKLNKNDQLQVFYNLRNAASSSQGLVAEDLKAIISAGRGKVFPTIEQEKAVYAAKLQMMRNFINKLERSIKKTTIYTASDPRAQELFQFVKNNFSVDEQREILKKWHEMTPKGLSLNELLREILPTIRRFSHIDEESYQRRID